MAVEVSIVPFKYKHLELLIEMLKSRDYMGVSEITMKTLPKIGYIALMGNQPIAAGFLRRVEGGYAQLDTLCSNAYFGSEIRHRGIQLVVDTLVNDAKSLKLSGIIAFTSDKGTLERALSIGFHVVASELVIGLSL